MKEGLGRILGRRADECGKPAKFDYLKRLGADEATLVLGEAPLGVKVQGGFILRARLDRKGVRAVQVHNVCHESSGDAAALKCRRHNQ